MAVLGWRFSSEGLQPCCQGQTRLGIQLHSENPFPSQHSKGWVCNSIIVQARRDRKLLLVVTPVFKPHHKSNTNAAGR